MKAQQFSFRDEPFLNQVQDDGYRSERSVRGPRQATPDLNLDHLSATFRLTPRLTGVLSLLALASCCSCWELQYDVS